MHECSPSPGPLSILHRVNVWLWRDSGRFESASIADELRLSVCDPQVTIVCATRVASPHKKAPPD